jgi:hypothetical protein
MSDPETPPPGEPRIRSPERPRDPPPSRNLGGCLVAFLVVVGVVLTLPGVCTVLAMGFGGGSGVGWFGIMLLTFLIAGGGIWLIAWAVRNREGQ